MHDIGPAKASPGRLPRRLGPFLVVIALCGLALAVRQAPADSPAARLVIAQAVPVPRLVRPQVPVPVPVAGLDDRFLHSAPGGLDARFAIQARPGLDDGILVAPSRLSHRPGAITPPRLRVVPVPRPWPPAPRLP
jgi:hypothetical protein